MSDNVPVTRPTRGVIGLIAALVGIGLMAWSFPAGILAALDGSGSGALPYEIVFLVGAALVLAALVLAIVHLVRGQSRPLAIVTIVIALLPIIAVIVIAVRSNASL